MQQSSLLNQFSLVLGLIFLAGIGVWFAGKLSLEQPRYELASLINDKFQCDANQNSSGDKLVVYVSTPPVAQAVAQLLCENPIIQRHYQQVQAYWGSSSANELTFIGRGIGDLVNTKPNIIRAFDAEQAYGYQRLASYAKYPAYLIGRNEKPLISREYLLGRRIGLLDYPTSQSGHVIPMRLLRELDLDDHQVELIYSHSHSALRTLLERGEVDMIASYWDDKDEQRFSKNYIQEIGENDANGSSWYVKMDARDTDLYCAMQTVLLEFAKQQQQNSSYFGDLEITDGCPQTLVRN